MRTLKLALLAGALGVIPAGALAQDLGATIYGSDGKPVGTVAEVNEQVVVIDTGKHRAPVPVSMVFDAEKGQSVNATREQVDIMMDERVAQARVERDKKLVQGASVVSVGGRGVGKLASVDLANDVILLEAEQGMLRLRKEHFAVSPQGHLTVLYSRDQIASAASGGRAMGGAQ